MSRLLSASIVIAAAVLLVVVAAKAELEASKQIEQVESQQNEQSTDVEEGRIRKHHLLYGGLLGGGLGGLHTLAVLYAIKVKILVVAAIVGLAVYYYGKFGFGGFGKGAYETILPYEGYSPYGPPGYSSQSEIFAESGPPSSYTGYTGYSNSGPYSAYGDDSHDHHQDHHDFSSLSHHAHGFEEHSAGDFSDRSVPSENGPSSSASDSSFSAPPASAMSPMSPMSASSPIMSEPPASRHKRQIDMGILENINWGEIAFQFLGVDTMGCRKRFVCELDFRATRNPFTRLVYELIGKSFFDRYRDLAKDAKKPTQFEDCSKMYRECAAAAKYENNEDEDEAEEEEVHTTEESQQHTNTDEETTPEQATKDEDAPEPELNNELGRMLNMRRLVMLRADQ